MELNTIIYEVQETASLAAQTLAAGNPETAKHLLIARAEDVLCELGPPNPDNEALRKVSGILAVIETTPQPPSSIIVRKHEILLVVGKLYFPADRIIAYLDRQRIQEGLSSLEWDLVEARLRMLIKAKML